MLTREERAFFVRNGFVQVRKIIPQRHCAQMIDWTNERLPSTWSEDIPSTWSGRATDACHSNALAERRGRLVYRVADLRNESALVETYGSGSKLASIASALIGSPIAPAKHRGLYPIFPIPDEIQYPPYIEAHNEAHPSHIITVAYLNDVGPHGGGLLVWPGSHRAIYPTMSSKLEFAASSEYQKTFDEWEAKEPVELTGTTGDVILLHHRLLHAPGVNRSEKVRYGFLCDFRSKDFLARCAEAPTADVWEDWAMADFTETEITAPSDFSLKPQSHQRDKVGVERLLDWADEADSAMKRKSDASVLERMRTPGDCWLILSDSDMSVGDQRLYPQGTSLSAAGARIDVDGQPCPSICQYDYFVRLPDESRPSRIRVKNLRAPCWLRIVRTRLPLTESDVDFCIEVEPGTTEVRLAWGEGGLRIDASRSLPSRVANLLLSWVPPIRRSRSQDGAARYANVTAQQNTGGV